MKKLLALAICGAATLAGCGSSVDRDGSRDNIAKGLEQFGTVDKDCVGKVLDSYSDDELLGFADTIKDAATDATVPPAVFEYQSALFACVTPLAS